MKTSPGMLGIGKLFWVFVLIPHLAIWSINGEKACNEQLYVKRYSVHTVSAGNSFALNCPVKYCTNRPNVSWCKLEEKTCHPLDYKRQNWNEKGNISVFILHFNPLLPSDTGSYRCSADFPSGHVESHSVTINVTAEQKKPSDTAGREINVVDVPQLFRNEQTEAGTRQNPQTLPSGTSTYDNDPWLRVQEETEVYSNPCLEENKQSIVYASLNHSVIGINAREARNVKEAPTEYAAICVRS
uniref:B- and T-lymphocyte attenuator isoform X2 n=1 Tax=Nyctereutes procyonoides TaxID=34880 RepID=UPI0024452D68|nr:B- and T-lymphocyte attenuator isoform X2 [Nyctereutes procyonoides]